MGAAVTVALCGHWEHPPPCYWPHHSAIDATARPVSFRTVFAAPAGEERSVRELIGAALTGSPDWRLLRVVDRPLSVEERELGEHLAAGPRASRPLVER